MDGDVQEKIRKQLEFYFSAENFPKDKFLQSQQSAEGYVAVSLLAGFAKVKAFKASVEDIVRAVKDSSVLELSEDETGLRRRAPLDEVPDTPRRGAPRAPQIKRDNSVFVGNLHPSATEDVLEELFAQVGPVRAVRLPLDPATGQHKKFAFVEFLDGPIEPAERSIQYAMKVLSGVLLFGQPLRVNPSEADKTAARTVKTTPDLYYQFKESLALPPAPAPQRIGFPSPQYSLYPSPSMYSHGPFPHPSPNASPYGRPHVTTERRKSPNASPTRDDRGRDERGDHGRGGRDRDHDERRNGDRERGDHRDRPEYDRSHGRTRERSRERSRERDHARHDGGRGQSDRDRYGDRYGDNDRDRYGDRERYDRDNRDDREREREREREQWERERARDRERERERDDRERALERERLMLRDQELLRFRNASAMPPSPVSLLSPTSLVPHGLASPLTPPFFGASPMGASLLPLARGAAGFVPQAFVPGTAFPPPMGSHLGYRR